MTVTPFFSRRRFAALAATAALGLLTGCANQLSAKVTSFNAWPTDAAGSNFAFLRPASMPSNSAGDLEQATYEAQASTALQSLGLKAAEPGQQPRMYAEVITKFSTREKLSSEPAFSGSSYFVPGYRNRFGFYHPGYWVGGFGYGFGGFGPGYLGERLVVDTVNTSRLKLRLLDTKGAEPGKPLAVYEATAVYAGENPDLSAVVPYLVRAALDGFPNQNGQVRVVRFDTQTGQIIAK
jgi:Domain of unknown function (DUF4136)